MPSLRIVIRNHMPGVGILLVRNIMDQVTNERCDGMNIVTFSKDLEEDGES